MGAKRNPRLPMWIDVYLQHSSSPLQKQLPVVVEEKTFLLRRAEIRSGRRYLSRTQGLVVKPPEAYRIDVGGAQLNVLE